MTFDELKALLVDWYEAGRAVNLGSMRGVDEFMDVQYTLREYARTLYDGRGETEDVVKGVEVTE